jgi:uncharacterized membrane protein
MVLNSEGSSFDIFYVYDQETISAKWLKNYGEENVMIYLDRFSDGKLISQGGIFRLTTSIDLIKLHKVPEKGYIYLRQYSVAKGRLLDSSNRWQNVSEYKDEFASMEKTYANAGSEVWMI